MGEEVRDPARTIPRAVVTALAGATAVYAVVAVVLLGTLGPEGTAASAAPLADAVAAGSWPWAGAVVRVGAVAAATGALLALLAGVARTTLAMAREADLPPWLAAVHPVHRVPAPGGARRRRRGVRARAGRRPARGHRLLARSACSSTTSSPTSPRWGSRPASAAYPRALQVLGAVSCVLLVLTLPLTSVLAGVAVLAAGVAYRLVRLARAGRAGRPSSAEA